MGKELSMVKKIVCWILIGLVIILALISVVYISDMSQAYQRVTGKSEVINSPYGDIEYKEGGSGPNVLVIHGSGGGYDQGELLARAVLNEQFHWIAPSRFGYLKSTFNEGATFDHQAHAYAYLLDQLEIKKVAVVAISHGGPSALLFASLYPERVSSLTLISAGVNSSNNQEQKQANRQGNMLMTIFKYDPLYWSIAKFFKTKFMEIMGANDAVIASLTPSQKRMAEHLIDYMNPVSLRSAGASFDNKASMPNERISTIKTPTLIFHATDDTLQLYHNAEYAAANIQGARLVSFNKGGHLLVFVEQGVIRKIIEKHIGDYVYK
ncbi:MAG: alpha/beta hydrolase [Peptococcaceae bacterium]|nr:alpha/beta hydrolase [Peptococcaceae bacterium]